MTILDTQVNQLCNLYSVWGVAMDSKGTC